jgi:alkanesulfonate monooxygenase SsuD/methylene tetrahydromethanopterin reductase-like flavin-dependent oxidoreductase (luciferase family)
MEYGVTMFPTDFSMGPAELAVAVEERGFDALFIPDHTHIPASRDSAFRIANEMPPDYSHNLDMFLGLAAAAAVTKRIRLGTGICLVVERDPIITAKEIASLAISPAGASISASAAAGTARKWKTTAATGRDDSNCSASDARR